MRHCACTCVYNYYFISWVKVPPFLSFMARKIALLTCLQNVITLLATSHLQILTGLWIITVRWNISLTKLSPLISPISVIRWTNEFYFEHNMWHCLKIAGMNWSWQVFSCSSRQWLPFIIRCTFICQILQSAILICVCCKAKVTLINILQNQKK